MSAGRKLKLLVFGMMNGNKKRGCPHKECTDNIVEWYGASLQEVNHSALDRSNCRRWRSRHWTSTGIEPMANGNDDDDDDDDNVEHDELSLLRLQTVSRDKELPQ